jgi:hypothetical protein
MSDKEIIEVVAAHAAGKRIQSRGRFESGDWNYNNHPEWQFGATDYRVSPEFLKGGYCFPCTIHDEPTVGMIKVQQVELEKGENPLPRRPREWWIGMTDEPNSHLTVSEFELDGYIHVREVME